ncbi:ANKRD39 [Symbiodinium sp. CCMP2592]|nr:ANKRD39 [Symbiodinium sp. CCMP2592]
MVSGAGRSQEGLAGGSRRRTAMISPSVHTENLGRGDNGAASSHDLERSSRDWRRGGPRRAPKGRGRFGRHTGRERMDNGALCRRQRPRRGSEIPPRGWRQPHCDDQRMESEDAGQIGSPRRAREGAGGTAPGQLGRSPRLRSCTSNTDPEKLHIIFLEAPLLKRMLEVHPKNSSVLIQASTYSSRCRVEVGVFENFDAKLSSGNWTAAHYAAMSGQAAELEFLQEAGADLQASNWQGCTPLHLAAYFGKVEALRVLIEAGVNRNPLDEAGNTPTDDAARKGHLEAFKLLLQAGETREAEILPWL